MLHYEAIAFYVFVFTVKMVARTNDTFYRNICNHNTLLVQIQSLNIPLRINVAHKMLKKGLTHTYLYLNAYLNICTHLHLLGNKSYGKEKKKLNKLRNKSVFRLKRYGITRLSK